MNTFEGNRMEIQQDFKELFVLLNDQHLLAALDDFGFASVNLKQSGFQSPEAVTC